MMTKGGGGQKYQKIDDFSVGAIFENLNTHEAFITKKLYGLHRGLSTLKF